MSDECTKRSAVKPPCFFQYKKDERSESPERVCCSGNGPQVLPRVHLESPIGPEPQPAPLLQECLHTAGAQRPNLKPISFPSQVSAFLPPGLAAGGAGFAPTDIQNIPQYFVGYAIRRLRTPRTRRGRVPDDALCPAAVLYWPPSSRPRRPSCRNLCILPAAGAEWSPRVQVDEDQISAAGEGFVVSSCLNVVSGLFFSFLMPRASDDTQRPV